MIRTIHFSALPAAAFLFLALTVMPSGPAQAICTVTSGTGSVANPDDGDEITCDTPTQENTGVGATGVADDLTVTVEDNAAVTGQIPPSAGIRAGDGATIDIGDNGQVVGFDGNDGINVGNDAKITNDGHVEGEGDGNGISGGDDGVIINDGTIEGDTGVEVGDGNTITNNGTIAGVADLTGVSMGSGNTLINTGSIEGGIGPSVASDGGDNTLILGTGSDLDGQVILGVGELMDGNIVRLRGAGSEDDDFTVPDGELIMEGEVWTLEGSLEFRQATVETGILNITGGDSLVTNELDINEDGEANITGLAVVADTTDVDGKLEVEGILDTDNLNVNSGAITEVSGVGFIDVDDILRLGGILNVDLGDVDASSLVNPDGTEALISGDGTVTTLRTEVKGQLGVVGYLVTTDLDVKDGGTLEVGDGGEVLVGGGTTTTLGGTLDVEAGGDFFTDSLVVPEGENALIQGLGEVVAGDALVRGGLVLDGRLVVVDDLVVTPGGGIFVSPGIGRLQADEFRNAGLIDLAPGAEIDILGSDTLEIGSGGVLSGGGDVLPGIVNGNVVVGGDILDNGVDIGTVSPGNSIGTLLVNGDFDLTDDGVLLIEIDERGNSDKVIVDGDADLAGTILIASDADADGLGDFFDVAILASGEVIDNGFDSRSAGRAFATAVVSESNQSVLVGAISPAQLDARVDLQLDNGFLFLQNASSRLMDVRNGVGQARGQVGAPVAQLASTGNDLAVQLAALTGPMRPEVPGHKGTKGGFATWARGLGWYGGRDAEDGVLGYDNWLAGVSVGADYAFADSGWTAGALFTYTRGWSDVDADASKTDADNYLWGAYAGFDRGRFFADLAIGGGFSNYDGRRRMTVLGSTTTAKSSFDGANLAVRAAAGMDFAVGELFVVRPVVSVDYVWADLDGYTESGAGVGNLSVGSIDAHALKLQGVAVLTQSYDTGEWTLIPEFRIGVVGQLALDDREVGAALAGITGTGVLDLNQSDEVRAALGLGVTLKMVNCLSAYIDMGGELGTDTRNATASGGVRFLF